MTLQLKITLRHSANPSIWRRIQVLASLNFYQLHLLIQGAFNWQLSHLFRFGKNQRDYPGIGIAFPNPMFGEEGVIEADKTLIKDYLKTPKQSFYYVYDFGDNWEHDILVEEILEKKTRSPQSLGGAGFGPPEDCGGIPGYYRMLEALDDPKHEEHEMYIEWLGMEDDEYLDKDFFSKTEATKKMRHYLKLYGDKNIFQ
ncbi:MAG: plasmid pRiA4b ORF-3 family protein [Bacteroidota bacterium]